LLHALLPATYPAFHAPHPTPPRLHFSLTRQFLETFRPQTHCIPFLFYTMDFLHVVFCCTCGYHTYTQHTQCLCPNSGNFMFAEHALPVGTARVPIHRTCALRTLNCTHCACTRTHLLLHTPHAVLRCTRKHFDAARISARHLQYTPWSSQLLAKKTMGNTPHKFSVLSIHSSQLPTPPLLGHCHACLPAYYLLTSLPCAPG